MKNIKLLSILAAAATLSGCGVSSLENFGMDEMSKQTGLDKDTLGAVKDGNVDSLQDKAMNEAAKESGVDADLVDMAKDPASIEGKVKADAEKEAKEEAGFFGKLF